MTRVLYDVFVFVTNKIFYLFERRIINVKVGEVWYGDEFRRIYGTTGSLRRRLKTVVHLILNTLFTGTRYLNNVSVKTRRFVFVNARELLETSTLKIPRIPRKTDITTLCIIIFVFNENSTRYISHTHTHTQTTTHVQFVCRLH